MLPTLGGRIQSRIVFLAIIGGLITLIITPLLPLGSAPLGTKYRDTFIILVTVIVLGIAWEFLYQLIMQWRWEKDWPTFFGFITGIPEGLLVWGLLKAGVVPGIVGTVPVSAFIIDFAIIWICVWLWVNGPMRVVNIRWRFHGGRLV